MSRIHPHPHRPRIHRRKHSFFYYSLPYVVLGAIVVLVILSLKLLGFETKKDFFSFNHPSGVLTLNLGQAEILLWGNKDWKSVPRGMKIFKGDSVRTGGSSRLDLGFFDEKISAHLGDKTILNVADLTQEAESKILDLNLTQGQAWIDLPKDIAEVAITATAKNAEIYSVAGSFAIELNEDDLILRVLSGSAQLKIFDNTEEKKLLSKVSAGVGQKIVLNDNNFYAIKNNQTVELLTAIDDEFKNTDWYNYNIQKTKVINKDDFDKLKIAEENNENVNTSTGKLVIPAEKSAEEIVRDDSVNVASFTTTIDSPVVIYPAVKNIEVSDSNIWIKGTVAKGTAKIIVNDYNLQKFKSGDRTWMYRAAEQIGNLKPGVNEYKIIAVDINGKESKPTIITINYNKKVVEPSEIKQIQPVVNSTDSASSGSASTTKVEEEIKTVKEDIAEKTPAVITTKLFSAPAILSPNDGLETDETRVIISGTVAPGTAKVIVNDYALSQFKLGDTTWRYIADESFSNFVIGKNGYRISAISEDGQKSEEVIITITRKEK